MHILPNVSVSVTQKSQPWQPSWQPHRPLGINAQVYFMWFAWDQCFCHCIFAISCFSSFVTRTSSWTHWKFYQEELRNATWQDPISPPGVLSQYFGHHIVCTWAFALSVFFAFSASKCGNAWGPCSTCKLCNTPRSLGKVQLHGPKWSCRKSNSQISSMILNGPLDPHFLHPDPVLRRLLLLGCFWLFHLAWLLRVGALLQM